MNKLSMYLAGAVSLALSGLNETKERVVSRPIRSAKANKEVLLTAQQKRERKNALRLALRVQ